jgi:hypothetical protein
MTPVNLARLADPFPIQAVSFYPGPISTTGTRCQAVPFVTSLHLCARLDEVVGPDRWSERYQSLSDGTYRCGLAIRSENRWLTRWSSPFPDPFDALPDIQPCDSFTEVALKWGLGRYLTLIPPIWVQAQVALSEQGRPLVAAFDQFAARAQLARILSETGQLEASCHVQAGCPTCERRQQLLFDIEALQVNLNHNGDCLTLDWPAIRKFSHEELVLFHAGLETRLKMLFEEAPPPHKIARKTPVQRRLAA